MSDAEAVAAAEAIQEVRVMRLQPGDIIVAKVFEYASYDSVQTVKKHLETFFEGHRVLVLSGIDLNIARPHESHGEPS